ncbi:hypothetical protein [Mucilaginibacter ginsenosidivorans]|uniref:DUF2147 domain-containing protein n=1 Tax=Mucilaginibacter ginsenosidivorans TaxID=398053 RepID=A0A5B8USH3_9SPHI|nr:hypothetical protein [Mucilaginibacter ginsenosidivorans]QEC61818.1 hypothetical protein FRZ54_04195 [Mucilaginibacter ginsenosidivorans]
MKYIFAIIFLFFSSVVFAQYKNQDLVGKWEGADSQGTKASIQFLDTTKVIVIINGKAMPLTPTSPGCQKTRQNLI